MKNKKQIKTAFNKLLSKSIKNNFTDLESKLQPQNFDAANVNKSTVKNRFKIAYAFTSLAALTIILGIIVSISINHNGAKLITPPENTSEVSQQSSVSRQSAIASSSKQSSFSQQPSPNFSSKQQSSASQQPVFSSSKQPSFATGSSSLPQQNTHLHMNAPAIPAEPQILDYNHRLYISDVYTWKEKAVPQDLIGYITFGQSVPVYTVMNEAAAKSICLLCTYESPLSSSSNSYLQYNYLCDDSFTAKNRTFNLIPSKSSSILNVVTDKPVTNAGSNSNANGYSMVWNFGCQYPSTLQTVNEILGDEIGTIPSGGTVYAIDEIDPSQAVYINIDKNWFLIAKADGYSGKTVFDVMKDKGVKQSVMN